MIMPAKIISINGGALQGGSKAGPVESCPASAGTCRHDKMAFPNRRTRTAHCSKCGEKVDPFDALLMIYEHAFGPTGNFF